MNRNLLHFTVDLLLFLAVLGLVLTGLLMAFVVPPGQGGALVWNRTRHDWGDLHYWIALSMLTLVVLHVLLNWTWVCAVVLKLVHRDPAASSRWKQTLAGLLMVLLLAGVVTIFLFSAWSAKVPGVRGDHGPERGPGQGLGPRQFRGGQ